MMTREGFFRYVQYHIKEALPDEFRSANVSIQEVYKHNDRVLHGLEVLPEGQNSGPIVYLDSYYEAYLNGEDIYELLSEIADQRVSVGEIDLENGANRIMGSFEDAKDHLYVRLCDSRTNEKRLENVLWTDSGLPDGLAATVHVEIQNGMSAAVTPALAKTWGVREDVIFNAALRSMQEKSRPECMMLSNAVFGGMTMSDEENLLKNPENYREGDLIVLTNRSKQFGASVMLYPGVLDRIGMITGGDFYIIPSSLHEVLIVPESLGMREAELTGMLRNVNEEVVDNEDKLSDNLLVYDRQRGELSFAGRRDHEQVADKVRDSISIED